MAPVGTRSAPAPEYARRPHQNQSFNASLESAPAGTRRGTRVFCDKSWAAVRFPSSSGSLLILLIKKPDSKRAHELRPRTRMCRDFLEFYGTVGGAHCGRGVLALFLSLCSDRSNVVHPLKHILQTPFLTGEGFPPKFGARRHPLGARSRICTPPTPKSLFQCVIEVGTRWHPPRRPRVLRQVVGCSAISIIVRLSIYITN